MHHLSICSKCGYGHSSDTCVTDEEVVAWFDSQSEEFLAALPGYEDGLTPRRAWNEFFSSSPATETAPASSPAQVVAGQGEGTLSSEYLRACSDFCDFCDSLIEMNVRAIKERRPFDDPNRFLGAIELMQTFVRFQKVGA